MSRRSRAEYQGWFFISHRYASRVCRGPIQLKSLQRELSEFEQEVETLQQEYGVVDFAGKAKQVEDLRSAVLVGLSTITDELIPRFQSLREHKSRIEGKVSQLVDQQRAVSHQLDSTTDPHRNNCSSCD